MGYRVTSFLSVGSADRHDHFLYFLPTRWLAYEWINTWIDEHFDSLASHLGPSAVLITTPRGVKAEHTYGWDSIEEMLHRSLRPSNEQAAGSTHVRRQPWESLHSGAPVLIVSRRPLTPRDNESVDCVAINLAAYDKHGIATLLDQLIQAVQSGDDPLAAVPTALDRTDWSRYEFLKALELKPNVFGVGVNGNAVIDLVRKWRKQHREASDLSR